MLRIKGEQVAACLKVVFFKGLAGDRNELGLGRRGPGTLGKPSRDPRPKDVGFASNAPLDPGIQLVVVGDGNLRRKFFISAIGSQALFTAKVGEGNLGHELPKHQLLGRNGIVSHLLQARNPAAEAPVYEVGDRREGHALGYLWCTKGSTDELHLGRGTPA